MRYYILILLFYCSCSLTGRKWYVTETGKENKDECKEIIKEKLYRNGQYKKVIYKIKKECRKQKRGKHD